MNTTTTTTPPTHVQLLREDVGYAVFGLGLYIEHCVQDGQNPEELKAFMQAYLDIRKALEALRGPRCPDCPESTQEEADPQTLERLCQQEALSWLPRDEKERDARQLLRTLRCTTCHPQPCESFCPRCLLLTT